MKLMVRTNREMTTPSSATALLSAHPLTVLQKNWSIYFHTMRNSKRSHSLVYILRNINLRPYAGIPLVLLIILQVVTIPCLSDSVDFNLVIEDEENGVATIQFVPTFEDEGDVMIEETIKSGSNSVDITEIEKKNETDFVVKKEGYIDARGHLPFLGFRGVPVILLKDRTFEVSYTMGIFSDDGDLSNLVSGSDITKVGSGFLDFGAEFSFDLFSEGNYPSFVPVLDFYSADKISEVTISLDGLGPKSGINSNGLESKEIHLADEPRSYLISFGVDYKWLLIISASDIKITDNGEQNQTTQTTQ